MSEQPAAEKDAPDLLARLRDEVIAVVAEGLWDGNPDRQPHYDRIAALYDDAASNVLPPGVCDCTWNSADGRPHGVACPARVTPPAEPTPPTGPRA